MGQRPNADLFFGYVFNKTGAYPWEENEDYDYDSEEHKKKEDWDDSCHILHAYGIDWEPLNYKELCSELEKIGVTIGSWGSLCGECSYYIRLLDPSAFHSTDWDDPLTIASSALQSNDAYVSWIKPLEEFAAKLNIDLKGQKPAWHMVASFG